MSPPTTIALALLLPFLCALGIIATGRRPNLRDAVTVA